MDSNLTNLKVSRDSTQSQNLHGRRITGAAASKSANDYVIRAELTTSITQAQQQLNQLTQNNNALNTALADTNNNLSLLLNSLRGIIAMWSGLLVNIPTGWQLCDGTNGTPDLRGKFIKGSAAGIDPGVTGGASTYNYTPAGLITWPVSAPTNSNISISGSTATEASHTHSVTSNVTNVAGNLTVVTSKAQAYVAGTLYFTSSIGGTVLASGTTSVPQGAETLTNNAVTSTAGSSHSHGYGTLTASTPTISWPVGVPTFSGTVASIPTEPTYYSLAFIMKI